GAATSSSRTFSRTRRGAEPRCHLLNDKGLLPAADESPNGADGAAPSSGRVVAGRAEAGFVVAKESKNRPGSATPVTSLGLSPPIFQAGMERCPASAYGATV